MTNEWARPLKSKQYQSNEKTLENSISKLEKVLQAATDIDDNSFKAILELYQIKVASQREDIALLKQELYKSREKARGADEARTATTQLQALQAELDAREDQCIEQNRNIINLESKIKRLEGELKQRKASLDACNTSLSEERRWRLSALAALKSEISLTEDTESLLEDLGVSRRCDQHGRGSCCGCDSVGVDGDDGD